MIDRIKSMRNDIGSSVETRTEVPVAVIKRLGEGAGAGVKKGVSKSREAVDSATDAVKTVEDLALLGLLSSFAQGIAGDTVENATKLINDLKERFTTDAPSLGDRLPDEDDVS